ncbi:MAG: response regulator, partial [Desulforhopalus sp.]
MSVLPKILLVDDEERFVKSLQSILSHYDYGCTVALNGAAAVNHLKNDCFQLALLDVELPDMSGCDIAEYIKKSHPTTTAIMLTGVNTVETAVRAMKQGAYDFLSKPINHELLIKTIEKALQHNTLTRELYYSEKKYQALAEASWEGIVLHDNGRLLEANDQFFELFGFTPVELKNGRFLDKILAGPSLSVVENHIKNAIFTRHEILCRRKDGTEFPVETNSRMTHYLGKPARVCAMRDLSDRVKAEQENLALQENLAKANKLNALGLMAGSVAHDLNNILSGIVSYPDLLLLKMDKSDAFYPEIQKIQAAGKRAAAVVSDLVVLARGGSLETTVEDVNSLILDHLNSLEHRERLSIYPDVVILTNLQQDLHNARCSQQNIHKILLNLIGNALESVQENGLIRITTQNCQFINPMDRRPQAESGRDYIKISIADNGPGIPAKDLDHIFDPFYTTKVMGKSGTGLGLSIVWNTVQEHNGWIEVKDNRPGAVFEIYLPACLDRTAVKDAVNYCSPQGNGETILLIDDQPEQNETMGKLLTKLGYKTFSANSGEEGIAFIQSKPVDLVLLDMIMGDGLNGSETFERILKVKPGQKAIMISGYSRDEDVLKAKNLGIS